MVDRQIPRGRPKRKSGRTEMPLLRPVGRLHVDRIRLFDHVLASPPGTHSRCPNGIFLVPARSYRIERLNRDDHGHHQGARTVSL